MKNWGAYSLFLLTAITSCWAQTATNALPTTPSWVTTEAPKNDTNGDVAITAKLRSIYETKGEGCVKGNREYTRYLKGIREAITWSSSRLADKIRVHDEFIAYNKERLSLEQQITARIDKIVNTLLPKLGKLSRCKFFYQKQKRVLKRAINSSNAQKRKILKKNSVNCEA